MKERHADNRGAALILDSIESPLGRIYLLAEGDAIVYAGFAHPLHEKPRTPSILRKMLDTAGGSKLQEGQDSPTGVLRTAAAELNEYFAGRRREFKVPLSLYGTPFQREIWQRLLEVPCGNTVTYGELAAAAGYPRSVRAAGTAVGMNPLSIIVPCHRVLPAAGGVGNYGGGPERKKELLRIEGAI
ncbi:MAG: methylated-DNA--[protein]-cysteine S-methyltransferase [Spirochaetota bacterium]|nr:methylated-DNA--[protein]-cysteine S-methyltransferase [Spirochaetota bacterium]